MELIHAIKRRSGSSFAIFAKGGDFGCRPRESLIYGLAEADKHTRADFLTPLRGWYSVFALGPTACAVGLQSFAPSELGGWGMLLNSPFPEQGAIQAFPQPVMGVKAFTSAL